MPQTTQYLTDAQRARRSARIALLRRSILAVVAAVVIFAVVHSLQKHSNSGDAHVATKLVTVTKSQSASDGVHVTGRLDAPSPNGTSHEIVGVIPTAQWNLSHVVWACYPPGDPDKGVLRSPLDPDCSTYVGNN